MIHPDEPIYPDKEFGNSGTNGLTKREYFAAMALSGLVGKSQVKVSHEDYCSLAVELSDALIKELNR